MGKYLEDYLLLYTFIPGLHSLQKIYFKKLGEVQLHTGRNLLIIHSVCYFYGNAATEELSRLLAADIQNQWNEARGSVRVQQQVYNVQFVTEGMYAPLLTPEMVFENVHPANNYFRIETYARDNISFADGVGSNTGYFKLDNLFDHSTTAAHEYGHSIGLEHPNDLDIRGQGVPGIMYPRDTIVDPPFQYDPYARPFGPGGTINPVSRKVLQQDINNLRLHRLAYNRQGVAVLGNFTSLWHAAHQP